MGLNVENLSIFCDMNVLRFFALYDINNSLRVYYQYNRLFE